MTKPSTHGRLAVDAAVLTTIRAKIVIIVFQRLTGHIKLKLALDSGSGDNI